MAINYSDVLDQLRAFGLHVSSLQTGGRFVRCKVEGDREKRGWYCLHEIRLQRGDLAIVGSYGIWHGTEQNAQKVELGKDTLISEEERAAIRQRLAEDKRRAEADQKRRAKQAALQAQNSWRRLNPVGTCDYLTRKGLNSPVGGVRFTPSGALAIPLQDAAGQIHGLQFVLDRVAHKDKIAKANGRDKQFWPPGLAKKGHYFQMGGQGPVVLVAEGYATAATLHLATGLPVVVAWDAGNLLPVLNALKANDSKTHYLICADNDNLAKCDACKQPIEIAAEPECSHCKQPHKRSNAGIEKANLAALATGAKVIYPQFADAQARFDHFVADKGKLTDFNDLYLTESLATVSHQVESALKFYGWATARPTRAVTQQGGGETALLKPIDTTDELIERFSLVYGKGGTVFDHQERMLVSLSDMRDLCRSRETHRRWQESELRKVVKPEQVGFDPAETDKNLLCNLWSGWPLKPVEGSCEHWLDLLYHICDGEKNAGDLARWVIKWLAYQVQNPGAKMQTAIVIYGPQGSGKNLLFEYPLRIFGRYGRIIGQFAMEDKFNDWASGKMLVVCNEVVSSSDKWHIKNILKALITDPTIRINPKNMQAYDEANHVNLVFLSNERMPVVLEEDDRRHFVVWTPPKREDAFYKAVAHEMNNGGVEALFHFLMHYDIADFNEHTKPPLTAAKAELTTLSKDSVLRFSDEWLGKDLDGIPLSPALTEDIYELYKYWCSRQGTKPMSMAHAIDKLCKRPGWRKERKRFLNGTKPSNPKFFLVPPGAEEMTPGNSETGWLGQCVDQFREALKEYKGNQYA